MPTGKEFQSDPNLEKRSQQRSKFLELLSPWDRRSISDFISPEKKIDLSKPAFDNKFKKLTEQFGDNTHILLFGLAATASTPQELSNVFMVLGSIEKTGWYQV